MYLLNKDILIKGFVANVVSCDPPIAKPTAHRIVECVVISMVSVWVNLNVPTDAGQNLSHFSVRLVVHAVDFDPWALLSLLVGHLAHISVNLIDGQAGSSLKITAVLYLYRPLVTRTEFKVF